MPIEVALHFSGTAVIVEVEGAPAKLPSTPFPANFWFADYPGMIGKGYADVRDLQWEEPGSGSLGNRPILASDLEVNHCQRYGVEGQDGSRPI
jgi:hypothetical protein